VEQLLQQGLIIFTQMFAIEEGSSAIIAFYDTSKLYISLKSKNKLLAKKRIP
jgi:hypothetical protein